MQVKEEAEGVYAISLAWSNAYALVEGNEAALIDTGLERDRADLLAGLRQCGIAPEQIRAVYLTHAHCDHAGSAAFFARQGAMVYLHTEELPFLRLPRRTYAPHGLHLLLRPLTAIAFTLGEGLYPVERTDALTTVAHNDVLNAPGGALRVLHSPGHTPGHAAYFRERDGLMFSGDAILNIIPVRRVTGLSLPIRMLSDNWRLTRQSARQMAQLPVRCLLAGHGWPLRENASERLRKWAQTLRPNPLL